MTFPDHCDNCDTTDGGFVTLSSEDGVTVIALCGTCFMKNIKGI